VLGNGLGDMANTQYHLTGTLGQPVIGGMTGSGTPFYANTVGFWYAQQSISSTTGLRSEGQLPTEFRLDQNYPNPFNPLTTINYQLPFESTVKLVLFDVLGRQITELVSSVLKPGYYSVRWDGTAHASGVYYARFTASDETGNVRYAKVSKLMFMK
jgi:hypothetical protein